MILNFKYIEYIKISFNLIVLNMSCKKLKIKKFQKKEKNIYLNIKNIK